MFWSDHASDGSARGRKAYYKPMDYENMSEVYVFPNADAQPEYVLLQARRSAKNDEDASKTARRLFKSIQPQHTSLDFGTSGALLGREGTRSFFNQLEAQAGRWTAFKAQSQQSSQVEGVSLPIILENLLLFPNLETVQLSFRITSTDVCASILNLLTLPKLQRLALTHRSFQGNLLLSFLRELAKRLPSSTLRHLSLYRTAPISASQAPAIVAAVLEVLSLRRQGLEYLNLKGLRLFQRETDVCDLMTEVCDKNTTIQWVAIVHDSAHGTGFWWDLKGEMEDALKRNRKDRRRTQWTALHLLSIYRTFLLPFDSSSDLADAMDQLKLDRRPPRTTIASLPHEIILEILACLDTHPLSARQVKRVMKWAGDRGTLAEGKRVGSRREFLNAMDCWRWDGYE